MATDLTALHQPAIDPAQLQDVARRHLWMHFTRMGAYGPDAEIPIIARGEGCYVYDEHGKRYLDGLSALFCVNSGHGREELADAAAAQMRELAFFTNWSYAHPRAIELAAKIASLTPAGLNRVFFTSGGSEAVESAWKLTRNYHRLRGDDGRTKIIARDLAYHGTSLGALAATGLPSLKEQFAPVTPGGCHVPNTNSLPRAGRPRPAVDGRRDRGADPRGGARDRRRPSSSSRSRTPAAASPRPTATSSACARSATATACCSSPTRSSARGAGSATCSAASASTTCRTSSRRRRA